MQAVHHPVTRAGGALGAGEGGGKWGVIDGSGATLIPPQFDYIADFEEGLAGARVGEGEAALWGFVNERGEWIIPARYPKTRPFSEGLAAVRDPESSLWGFLDGKGAFRIAPRFESALSFSEGLAPAKEPGKSWGYIDKSGSYAIAPRYWDAHRHSEGLAAVQSGSWSFIDRSGKTVFGGRYTSAGRFREGRAAVWVAVGGRLGTAVRRYCYFVDKNGKAPHTFSDQADGCGEFEAGRAPASLKSGGQLLWGFMDADGDFAIKAEFRKVRRFSDGLCAVQDQRSGAWGFIGFDGAYVLRPEYEAADDFVDGIAPVKREGSWVYIDKRGKIVLPTRYQDAMPMISRKAAGL